MVMFAVSIASPSPRLILDASTFDLDYRDLNKDVPKATLQPYISYYLVSGNYQTASSVPSSNKLMKSFYKPRWSGFTLIFLLLLLQRGDHLLFIPTTTETSSYSPNSPTTPSTPTNPTSLHFKSY